MICVFVLLTYMFTPPVVDDHYSARMLAEVNKVRAHGCRCGDTWIPPVPSVVWNDKLAQTAAIHARQMQQYNFYGHRSRSGKDVGERARMAGYPWRAIGENLGRGQTSAKEVVHDWTLSPAHCHVLMQPKFREMGVAYRAPYWVLHMGSRE